MRSTHSPIVTLLVVCLTLFPSVLGARLLPSSSAQSAQPSCGITSSLALATIYEREVLTETITELLKDYPEQTVSLFDVTNIAARLGFKTKAVKIGFDELVVSHKPAILHLKDPDHFVLMLDGSAQHVRLLEYANGIVAVVSRTELEKRFDGIALLPEVDSLGAPQVQFEATDFEFGIAGIGQKIEHDYQFSNRGSKPLKIEIGHTSCGCTVAFFQKTDDTTVQSGSSKELVLPPGSVSKVKLSFTAQTIGNVQQMVTVRTNDPVRPLIYLTIRGTSPRDVQVSPQAVSIDVQKQAGLRKTLQVTGSSAMDVTRVDCDDPTLQITQKLVSTDADTKVWQILITRDQPLTVGRSKATISIGTTHPSRPLITVPVAIQVQGDLQVIPSQAYFGFVSQRTKQQIKLIVQSSNQLPFALTGASLEGVAPGAIEIESTNQKLALKQEIVLTLNLQQADSVDGLLKVNTDVPGEETLTIPITAMVDEKEKQSGTTNLVKTPDKKLAALLPRAENDPSVHIGVPKPLFRVGDKAPTFNVSDSAGKRWDMAELRGKKNVLLTFFPRCFTGGCANHLSSLRD
jgi:hypothetical protein